VQLYSNLFNTNVYQIYSYGIHRRNWRMSCTASEIDVIELQVIKRPKFGLKHIETHSRT